MKKEVETGLQAKFFVGAGVIVLVLLAAWAIGHLFPGASQFVLRALRTLRLEFVASAIESWKWVDQSVLLVASALFVVYVGVRLALKLGIKSLWQRATSWVQTKLNAIPVPAGCAELLALQKRLYPDQDERGKPPILVGRDVEVVWLAERIHQSQTNNTPFVALLLYGPQGIGKTHLAYSFGIALKKGDVANCKRWQTWWINQREFDADALAETLPEKPTLLIWDDASLDDTDSKKRFDRLRESAVSRKKPLVVILTSWQSRSGAALTAAERRVEHELKVEALGSEAAAQIFMGAASLDNTSRGHPLYLRLMAALPPTDSVHDSSSDLWSLCQYWGREFKTRLIDKYAISTSAMHALAVVCSSRTMRWSTLQSTFSLTPIDLEALRQTGQIEKREGEYWLTPVRPDLLGWGFAVAQLEPISREQAEAWALAVWRAGLFDAGRFIQLLHAQGETKSVWATALISPAHLSNDVGASLRRAKAAANAVIHFGSTQQLDLMKTEIDVGEAIASRFRERRDVQLVRIGMSTNAAVYYERSGHVGAMKAEFDVSETIASRYVEDIEIQRSRATVAINAVACYGMQKQFDAMEAEIALSDAIAARFPEDCEIQLKRASVATNAISNFGAAQRFDALRAELSVSEVIASRFPNNRDVQLVRAKALANAVAEFGRTGQLMEVEVCVGKVANIAGKFPDEIEFADPLALVCFAACNLLSRSQNSERLVHYDQLLKAHLTKFPQLLQNAPFDRLVARKEPHSKSVEN